MDLHIRLKKFCLNVINYTEKFDNSYKFQTISRQLIRCSTSVAANYRSSQMARSRKEFISKIHICLEEIDESNFWIDLAISLKAENKELFDESNQLKAIFITILKKSKLKLK